MPVTTTKDFLAICRKSDLLTEEQLAEVQNWTEQTDEPKRMAATLAKREWVTRWQAHQLLNGRSTFRMGKYKLIDLLGRRGMGNVFLSQHTTMNRRVCLKIVSKKIGQDPQLLKRFLDEARAIATLDHENIVRAYSVDKEGDCFYIVMEYVEGKDLQELVLQDGPLASDVAAAYIQQAADGLAHAHEKGLIHGDIKPSSLVVSGDGVVKILDVGISEFTFGVKEDSGEQKQLDPQAVNCLAPELTGDDPQPDPRSDIYSLGCTLYFLLTGRPPFPKGTALERMEKHRSETPEPIVKLQPEASKNLAKVCHKMMAKNPDERFKSADVVQRILAEVAQLEQTNRRKSADGAAPPPPRDSDGIPAAAVAAQGKTGATAQPRTPAVDAKKTPAKTAAAAAPAKSAEQPAASKEAAPTAAKKKAGGKPDFHFLAEPASESMADVPAIQLGGKRKKKAAAAAAVAATPRAKARAAAPQTEPAAAEPAAARGPKKPSFLRRNKKWVVIGGAVALGLVLLAVAIPLAVYALSAGDKDDPAVAVEDSATGGEAAPGLIDDEGSVVDRDDEGSSFDRDDEGGSGSRDDEGSTPDAGDGGTALTPTEPPGDTDDGDSDPAPEPESGGSPDSGTDDKGGTTDPPPDDSTPDDSGSEATPTEPPPEEPPPAEPEPEEKEPVEEKPPEEPPKEETPPAKPKEPFKTFKPSVALLAADADGGDAPQNLAAVDVGDDSIWFVSLVGGEDVGKGKTLTLNSNNEDGPKQRWTLQLDTAALGQREATTADVANLWWEGGNLVFQWTKESESVPAGTIQSCLLDIAVEEETRTLALFEPKKVEPLVMAVQKALPVKIQFDEMPNRDKLKLEVTRLEGISEPLEKQPNGPVGVGQPLLLKILFTDAFNNRVPGIAFQVSFATIRDTLTINQRVAGSIADDPMVKQMRIKFPLNEQARSVAQSQIAKFEGQIKRRKDEQGKELRGDALAQRQNGMRFFDNIIKFDDLLKTFNENTKIHYRLFVDVEGREVDVARTEAPKAGGGGKKGGGK